MKDNVDRNLGEQPLAAIMDDRGIKSHDLVSASTDQITHKMVMRARKGRRLTVNVKCKIRNALNAAMEAEYLLEDLFNY